MRNLRRRKKTEIEAKQMLFNIQGRMREVERIVSATNAEGPPVPIPNTEVKLCSGENTLRATVREDSSVLTLTEGEQSNLLSRSRKNGEKQKPIIINYGGVAQLGEHLPCKQGVMGSNPIISTRAKARTCSLKTE